MVREGFEEAILRISPCHWRRIFRVAPEEQHNVQSRRNSSVSYHVITAPCVICDEGITVLQNYLPSRPNFSLDISVDPMRAWNVQSIGRAFQDHKYHGQLHCKHKKFSSIDYEILAIPNTVSRRQEVWTGSARSLKRGFTGIVGYDLSHLASAFSCDLRLCISFRSPITYELQYFPLLYVLYGANPSSPLP